MYRELLNVKSAYNFLSSTIKTPEYFEFLKKNNISNAFLVDTNSMYHTLDFYFEAKKNNLNPIVGVELEYNWFNLILIPKNNNGYRKVLEIFSKYNLLDDKIGSLADIKKIIDVNIIIRPILNDWQKNYGDIVGENIFIGIDYKNRNLISEQLINKSVFASDIRSIDEDFNYMKTLIAIRDSKKYDENFIIEKNIFVDEFEINKIISDEIQIKNMNKIISSVSGNVIEEVKPKIVEFKNNKNISSKNYLRMLCEKNVEEFFSNKNFNKIIKDQYVERLNYELDIIIKMGFENYFLVVGDYVEYAKKNNIIVGPGRGSASGSLVSFLLNITSIDPIEYDLIFERFLNIDRATLPDIDIDFQDDRRYEVIEYLSEKYKNNFALISTFQTIGVKNAIRDCAKIFNVPDDEINDALKNLIGKSEQFTEELFVNNKKLQQLKEKYPFLFEHAKFLVGLPRQSGTHAAGVVISSESLVNLTPLKIGINNINQIEYPAKYLESIGLIKMDILGLKNLSTIQDVIIQIEKTREEKIILNDISLNDEKTFSLLSNGETNSIFQFESPGMIDVLKKLKPNTIIDLASVMSLYRPGPMKFIPEFEERKKKNNFKTEFGNEIDEILKPTYGIIVYQEQVMKILQVYAGFTLNKSDLIRSAISKKNESLLQSFRLEFLNGAVKLNHKETDAAKLWEHIERFANYGFNKSHAIAYSMISYWMAYLKKHYAAEFYCAILNSSLKDKEKTLFILREFRRNGGKVLGPTIRSLITKYRVTNGTINMPLTAIRGVTVNVVENIRSSLNDNKEALQDKNNLFGILILIFNDQLTDEIFTNLVKAGVFDWYGFSRKSILKYNIEMIKMLKLVSKGKNYGDIDIDVLDDNEIDREIDVESFETEVLGFSVNTNVFHTLRKKNKNISLHKVINIQDFQSNINVLGRITRLTTHKDKNDDTMLFLDISDDTGSVSVMVFASTYKEIGENKLIEDEFCVINIKPQIYQGRLRCVLNKVINADLKLI